MDNNADLWALIGKNCMKIVVFPKMSTIFSIIIRKQCLHACDFFHLWISAGPVRTGQQVSTYQGQTGQFRKAQINCLWSKIFYTKILLDPKFFRQTMFWTKISFYQYFFYAKSCKSSKIKMKIFHLVIKCGPAQSYLFPFSQKGLLK